MLAFTVICHRDAVQKTAREAWGADVPILALMFEPTGGIEIVSKREVDVDVSPAEERARLERTYGEHSRNGVSTGISMCEYIYGRGNETLKQAMAGDFEDLLPADMGQTGDVPVKDAPTSDAPKKRGKKTTAKPAAVQQ